MHSRSAHLTMGTLERLDTTLAMHLGGLTKHAGAGAEMSTSDDCSFFSCLRLCLLWRTQKEQTLLADY